MNRTIREIMADLRENKAKLDALQAELEHVRSLTLNEQFLGARPAEMGTTGLVNYVRGEFWPYVPESTCFHSRLMHAVDIVASRYGDGAKPLFEKAVYAGRDR